MSKIGNAPITKPSNTQTTVENHVVKVTGPLGTLEQKLPRSLEVQVEGDVIKVMRKNEKIKTKAYHGLYRALIANMIAGTSTGWEKKLELVGTGYRAQLQGKNLSLSVGYSHPVVIPAADGIEFALDGQTKITVKGADRHLVGQTAATIRAVRPPEPYKGKGIRYENEVIRRKAGKAAKSGA